jgi:cytochrome c biogenesis protein CcmG, thiol:disulfide interchange protein DsbE
MTDRRRWSSIVGRWSLVAGLALTVAVSVNGAADRPAPAVSLPTADGSVKRLADLRGKVVLVDFWASWCVPCKASFPALDGLHRELLERGFEVLAINVDERRKDADAFLAGRSPAMTVLFDPKGATPMAFNVRAMPSSALIDRAGNIRFTHEGYTGKTLEAYRREIATLLAE